MRNSFFIRWSRQLLQRETRHIYQRVVRHLTLDKLHFVVH